MCLWVLITHCGLGSSLLLTTYCVQGGSFYWSPTVCFLGAAHMLCIGYPLCADPLLCSRISFMLPTDYMLGTYYVL